MRVLGPKLVARAKDMLGRSGFDEVKLVYDVFARNGKRGVMIDVGAHHGTSLGPFAQDGWRVIAFEPDDENRAFLVEAHGFRKNLTIDVRAVSNLEENEKPFFSSPVSTGISGLSAFHQTHAQHQTVDITTLAIALPTFGISHIDFLKIDTEGHDLFVLKGLDWNAMPPSVIVCEFENHKTRPLGYTTADLVDYLTRKDYAVTISQWWPIAEYGSTHEWRRFTDDVSTVDETAWGNLIAYKREPQFEVLGVASIAAMASINVEQ